MPIEIKKIELKKIHSQVVAEWTQQGSRYRPDPTLIDRIVAAIGDKKFAFVQVVSSESVAAQLSRGSLTLEQKFAIAKNGLDEKETADLLAILQDSNFVSALDQVLLNFVRALVGLEELAGVDSVQINTKIDTVTTSTPTSEQLAVKKIRSLVESGQLERYYDAAIGAIDDPKLKQEALELFNQLPVISTKSTAKDLVRLGFWKMEPRGYQEMLKTARYLPGRQILVETMVNISDVDNALKRAATSWNDEPIKTDVLAYDPKGIRAVTYRAILAGEDPANKDNFLVDVDSMGDNPPTRLSLPKSRIFELNQPHELGRSYVVSDVKQNMPYNTTTWTMDYTSPWAKAKLAEIAIRMDSQVAKLDFTKATVPASQKIQFIISRSMTNAMVDVQMECARTVFSAIDMEYPHNPVNTSNGRCDDRESDIGRQAIRGNGMCVQQATVLGGMLMPFADILGIDMQFKIGAVYRDLKPGTPQTLDPFEHGVGHGWWQLTFRPSMRLIVCDRTWNQPNHLLDKAYGFPKGDRYPHHKASGYRAVPVTSTDVNMDHSVEAFERQFAKMGDGREHHISNTGTTHG